MFLPVFVLVAVSGFVTALPAEKSDLKDETVKNVVNKDQKNGKETANEIVSEDKKGGIYWEDAKGGIEWEDAKGGIEWEDEKLPSEKSDLKDETVKNVVNKDQMNGKETANEIVSEDAKGGIEWEDEKGGIEWEDEEWAWGSHHSHTVRKTSFVMGLSKYGEWQDRKLMCKGGGSIVGYRIRVEPNQGSGDDTTMNGIQIRCSDGTESKKIKGTWGEWTSWHMCRHPYTINGFNLRSQEDNDDFDDLVGASDLNARCSNGEVLKGGGLNFGNWIVPHRGFQACPHGYHFCGVEARIEGRTLGDDTALNQLRFTCCHFD